VGRKQSHDSGENGNPKSFPFVFSQILNDLNRKISEISSVELINVGVGFVCVTAALYRLFVENDEPPAKRKEWNGNEEMEVAPMKVTVVQYLLTLDLCVQRRRRRTSHQFLNVLGSFGNAFLR
jgi:hypothetical protein